MYGYPPPVPPPPRREGRDTTVRNLLIVLLVAIFTIVPATGMWVVASLKDKTSDESAPSGSTRSKAAAAPEPPADPAQQPAVVPPATEPQPGDPNDPRPAGSAAARRRRRPLLLRRRAVEVHEPEERLLQASRRHLPLPGRRAVTRISARELAGNAGPFGRGVDIVRPDEVPEGSVVTVMRVPPEAAGMRLDRFVQSQLKRTSRTRAQVIVERGAYSPEARRLRGNDRVRAEQCVLLWRPPWDEKTPDVDLEVLYEDEHLLAVDKPAGMAVHPTARYHKSTVVKLLEAKRGDQLKLSHRIDRETSGVLLLAKTPEADRLVKVQFEERHSVTKKYVAITWGAPEEDEFAVDSPLELDPTSRYKVKMRVAAPGTGLASRTRFEVTGRRRAFDTGRAYAMLRCTLETGRQHQIRVHLTSAGTPIVGDKLYGPDEDLFARGVDGELSDDDLKVLELERHALHAAELELDHPITGARVRVTSPLPADLATFWRALEG